MSTKASNKASPINRTIIRQPRYHRRLAKVCRRLATWWTLSSLSESSYQCFLGPYPVDLRSVCISIGLIQHWTPSSEIYNMTESYTSWPHDVLPMSPTRYPRHGPSRIFRSQRGLYWYTLDFSKYLVCAVVMYTWIGKYIFSISAYDNTKPYMWVLKFPSRHEGKAKFCMRGD
jgi:hypothetical protein